MAALLSETDFQKWRQDAVKEVSAGSSGCGQIEHGDLFERLRNLREPDVPGIPLGELTEGLIEIGVALDELLGLDEVAHRKAEAVFGVLLAFVHEAVKQEPDPSAVADAKDQLAEVRQNLTTG